MLKKFNNLAILLLVISGLVWGVFGLYQINMVEYVFDREWLIRIIYVLFGVAFIYRFLTCRSESKKKKSRR